MKRGNTMKKTLCCLMFMLTTSAFVANCGEQIILRKEFVGRSMLNTKITDGWMLQRFWGGELSRDQGTLKLKATLERGSVWGRIMCPLRNGNLSGAKIKLEYKVKGSGKIKFGAIRYREGQKAPATSDYLWSELMDLTPEYKVYTHNLDFANLQLRAVNFVFEIKGEGEAVIDSMVVKAIGDTQLVITPLDPIMVKDTEVLPDVKFQTNRPGKTFVYYNSVPEKIQPVIAGTAVADTQGVVTVPGKALLQDQVVQKVFLTLSGNAMFYQPVAGGCGHCEMVMDKNKTVGSVVITKIPAKEYDSSLAAARNLKFKSVKTILVLADSIWDLDRGTNAADRMNFFLQKAHGKNIRVINYAVHGDRIDRMTDRFTDNLAKVEHGKLRYKALKNEKPDLIMIMLGHNDTAANSRDNFAKPTITPSVQLARYNELLAALRAKYPQSKIVLLSPLSVNYENILKRCEAQRKAGARLIFRYGDADKVGAFRQTLQRIASDNKLPYLDMYTPTDKLTAKATYFRVDSVHLSPRGFGLLAEAVMQELAKCNDL